MNIQKNNSEVSWVVKQLQARVQHQTSDTKEKLPALKIASFFLKKKEQL